MRLRLLTLLFLPFWALSQTSPAGVLTSAACKIWIDAGDMNADGNYGNNPSVNTAVTTWNDKSGNANDLTQATASAKPTYTTLGGFSCVKFDNSGANVNYLAAATQTMLTPGTMYFVLYMTDVGDGANCLFDRTSAGNTSLRFAQWNGTNLLGYTKYSTADYNSTISSSYSTNLVVSFLKTAASDNVTVAQNNSSATVTVGSANPGLPLYTLGKNSTSDGMNGFIMEAIAYNVDLNFAQKNIVDNYLSAKYGGISIISDKYAGDTPANGNYDFEVGGLGTESSGSNNSASSSVTGGLEVIQATAMENGEYLIYGHPTGANAPNTSDVGGLSGGANKRRWDRIWYFDWTHVGGTTETVNLTFDLSDGGMGGTPSAPLSNYQLLYRSGLSGSWTEVMSASSLAGDRITFNGLAWNTQGDGYYTIGTSNNAASPLPVELIRFKAEACNGQVCLNWATASEKNTDYFLIEKSGDAQYWIQLAKIKAAGNSVSRLDYEVIDQNADAAGAYYRLTMADLDGATSQAPIQFISFEKNGAAINVFPNPSEGIFTVTSANYRLHELGCELLNTNGELVKVKPRIISDHKMTLDLSDLPGGVYILNISSSNGKLATAKLVLK